MAKVEYNKQKAQMHLEGENIVVWIPMTLRRYGGRKKIIAPNGAEVENVIPPQEPNKDMVRALANAHRWLEMLESGEIGSVTELAKQESLDRSNLSKWLNLVNLAPNIQRAIMNGTQPETLTASDLRKPFPIIWAEQNKHFSMGQKAMQ
ncbi:hypothetical protein ACQZV8_18680 [Magnetococcales bacterium HHB-1]